MNFCKTIYISSLFGLVTFTARAQQDSLAVDLDEELEELVITGQYNPQAVNKSIYEVRVISREQIDRLAGNNLADVLNRSLNINVTPSAGTGKSRMGMFGFSSSYFKILVDNIPLVNDEDFGSNADLTQINLDDIERIEIVEGAMGVDYGANASAGIVNIITKKRMLHRWEITPMIQEETIGDEYNFNTKGRHIQALKVAHQLTDKIYIDVSYNRNDFKGHFDGRKGEKHMLDDGLRGHEWLPKLTQNLKGLMSYRGDNVDVFFKSEYFNENLSRHREKVFENYDPRTGTFQPYSNDERYITERFFNHLNASGMAKDWFRYDISLSYQEQTRNLEKYRYYIKKDEEANMEKTEYESRKVWYSKGTFSNIIKRDNFDFQVGYEISNIKGYTSPLAKELDNMAVERNTGSYDFFGSAEWQLSHRFSLRPGYRLMSSNYFSPAHAYSLSARYELPKGFELRAVLGNSPRIPSFDEMFTELRDVNHDVSGNPDLKPENGQSVSLHLKKNYDIEDGWITNRLSAGYKQVSDKIDLVIFKNEENRLAYRFENFDTFKVLNLTYESSIVWKNWDANFGITFYGNSVTLQDEEKSGDYLYKTDVTANIGYTIPKSQTTFYLSYKLNGREQQYAERFDENMNLYYEKGEREAFQLLDFTVRQKLLDNRLEITAGAKNILNVGQVRSSVEAAGAHTDAGTTILLGYGRHYFMKVLYKFKFD